MNCTLTTLRPHPERAEEFLDEELGKQAPAPDKLFHLITRLNLYPYKWSGLPIDTATLHQWRREASEALASQNCIAWDRSGSLVAAAAWAVQRWDSAQLGMRAAKLNLLGGGEAYSDTLSAMSRLLPAVLTACHRTGVRYLTTRADAAELATIHALQNDGFAIIDGIQSYVLPITESLVSSANRPNGVEFGLYEDAQQDQVVEIAKSAYQFDRFHSDPALDAGVADALHGDWLRNSCNGSAADAVVTAFQGQEVLGYVTLRFDHQLEAIGGPKVATIVLVAVKESAQGCGIGRYMTEWTAHWLRSVGVAAVQVGTQLANVPAARLYESVGFRYAGSAFTFRKLI